MGPSSRSGLPFALALTLLLVHPGHAAGQSRTAPTPAQLHAVLPAAERFSEKRGRPPVFEGYRVDPASGREALAGYAFLTSDLPPEMTGYSGPIEALVGMEPDGTITGVRVLEYHESLQETRGDFLARSGFQEQFAGKQIGDAFRIRRDIDGITGATITVRAMSLGVRNAARRVAAAYISRAGTGSAAPRRYIASLDAAELAPLSWPEMLDGGLGGQVTAGEVTISLIYVRDDGMGALLLGPDAFQTAVANASERVHEHHLMVLGIDGSRALGPLPRVIFAQGADTIRPSQSDFLDTGPIPEGKLEGAFRRPGLLLVDHALDVSAPFRIGLGRCCGDPPLWTDYVVQEPVPTLAPDTRPATARGDSGPAGASADQPVVRAPPPLANGEAATAAEEVARADADAVSSARSEAERESGSVRVWAVFLLTGLALAAVAALARGARTRAVRRGPGHGR